MDVFDFQKEIERLEGYSKRELNIIALILREKKPDIRSGAQLKAAIHRHMRAAKNLVPFSDDQIIKGMKKAQKLTENWTLETILKNIV